MAIFSKKMLIQRLERHMNNGYPKDDWTVTENQMLLYIDAAIPFVMKGQMFENAKVSGVFETPEAYLATYDFTIANQRTNTTEWYITLPQTPLALPDGYAITDVYFIDGGFEGQRCYYLAPKRQAYRDNIPKPDGVYFRIEGNRMYFKATSNQPLYNYNISVQMPISRTNNVDEVMNIPDDALEAVFNAVVKQLVQRLQMPFDVINDNLPPGNKNS